MKINSISTNYNQTNFKGVKEAETVWQKSKPTIQEALNALGDKNISIIINKFDKYNHFSIIFIL